MSRIDDILDVIDGGLQSSHERGYSYDNPSRCARCQTEDPVEGGDMCAGCRAFLLGDSNVDPKLYSNRYTVMGELPGRIAEIRPAMCAPLTSMYDLSVTNFPRQHGRRREMMRRIARALDVPESILGEFDLPGPLAELYDHLDGRVWPPNQPRHIVLPLSFVEQVGELVGSFYAAHQAIEDMCRRFEVAVDFVEIVTVELPTGDHR